MKKDGIQTRNRKVSQKSKKCKPGGYPELGELSLDYLMKQPLSHLTAASHLAAAGSYHNHKMAAYMSSYLDGVSTGYPSYPPVDNAAAVASAAMVAMGSGGQPSAHPMSQQNPFPLGYASPHQQPYRNPGDIPSTSNPPPGYFGDAGFQQAGAAYSFFENQPFHKASFPRTFFPGQQQQQQEGTGEDVVTPSQYPPGFLPEGGYEEGARMYPTATTSSAAGYAQAPQTVVAPNAGYMTTGEQTGEGQSVTPPVGENTSTAAAPVAPMY